MNNAISNSILNLQEYLNYNKNNIEISSHCDDIKSLLEYVNKFRNDKPYVNKYKEALKNMTKEEIEYIEYILEDRGEV